MDAVSAPFAHWCGSRSAGGGDAAGCSTPRCLRAVVAAGYDRDFDEVLAGARDALHPPVPCGRWREVAGPPGSVRLPRGVGLDLGGIAKGWTVDLAAAEAARCRRSPWAVVSAGGDLRIAGDAPPVEVAIEDPAERRASRSRRSAWPRGRSRRRRRRAARGARPPPPDRPPDGGAVGHRDRAGDRVGADLRAGRGRWRSVRCCSGPDAARQSVRPRRARAATSS